MTARSRPGLGLALAAALATVPAAARAQFVPAPYPRGYSFMDEPVMSVNRSYLGYSNFVDVSGRDPAFSNPTPIRAVRPGGYVYQPTRYVYQPRGYVYQPGGYVVAPARRGFHPFRRWR
jgi:hypothetical protein